MPATSEIVDQLIDGPGFVLMPNLIEASEAAQARSHALEIAASPSASAFGLNERIGQQHIRGLLAHGEIFERLVQHPALIEIAEAMLGDDMTLGAYSARILYPGRDRDGSSHRLSVLGDARAVRIASTTHGASHLDAPGFH